MKKLRVKLGALSVVFRLPRILKDRTVIRPAGPRRKRVLLSTSPELTELWHSLRREYFPECHDLNQFTVGWSRRRQRRTLASCEVRRKVVRVAKEMRDPLFAPYLAPLLYHEMCHAVLGEDIGYHRGRRAWHGPRFKALERRHPGIADLDAWIKQGGWSYAVRRSRALEQHAKRSLNTEWKQAKRLG